MSTAPTDTLDAYQIEAALQFIDEHWDEPMLPREREEWADALAYVRQGELKPVVERWTTTTRPSVLAYWRPSSGHASLNRSRCTSRPSAGAAHVNPTTATNSHQLHGRH